MKIGFIAAKVFISIAIFIFINYADLSWVCSVGTCIVDMFF